MRRLRPWLGAPAGLLRLPLRALLQASGVRWGWLCCLEAGLQPFAAAFARHPSPPLRLLQPRVPGAALEARGAQAGVCGAGGSAAARRRAGCAAAVMLGRAGRAAAALAPVTQLSQRLIQGIMSSAGLARPVTTVNLSESPTYVTTAAPSSPPSSPTNALPSEFFIAAIAVIHTPRRLETSSVIDALRGCS